MNFLNLIPLLEKLLDALLDRRLHRSLERLISGVRWPRFSYENLSLSYVLDIADAGGRRARLTREQQVRFLTAEAGVVRDLVWGDGVQSTGYRAKGAQPVARRQEGATQVIWLGLPNQPRAGETALVRSWRTIVDGLCGDEEFLEVRIERPTKRLCLRVLFPAGRPPKSAVVETLSNRSPRQPVVPRVAGGRVRLSWAGADLKPFETYRLRWTW